MKTSPLSPSAPALAVEVPGRVGGRDRAAQRVAADDHLAAELLGLQHHPVQVLDLDLHPPASRERDLRVLDRLVVVGDARIREVAEVVVEQLVAVDHPLLGLVDHGLVFEQVLAALDRPHLPAVGLLRDQARERLEVGGAGRGSGVEDEHVRGLLRPDLEDADLVELVRGRGVVVAGDPLELDRRSGAAREQRCARRNQCEHDRGLQPRHHPWDEQRYRLGVAAGRAAASRCGVSSSKPAKNSPTASTRWPIDSAANRVGW